jgi:hypothetical protein
MSRKVQRVRYHLDPRGIQSLASDEVKAILRGADDLIMRGGRTLLSKILKGSRSKDVLNLNLDQSPVYGYYRSLPEEEILARIDWTIRSGYLAIEYDRRLPLLVYTEPGWAIEKETYADELLRGLEEMLAPLTPTPLPPRGRGVGVRGGRPLDVSHLKDRNRSVIWRLLEKVEASGERKYLPVLEAWAQIDYKKVRQRIRQVMQRLNETGG